MGPINLIGLSILGAALDESRVEIWTDVDGVLTADPRIVPDARKLDEVSFQEMLELSAASTTPENCRSLPEACSEACPYQGASPDPP